MKNVIYLVSIILLIVSCKKDVKKDYVKLSGIINSKNSDSLIIANKNFSKTIKVNTDGTFSDTLNLENGFYMLFDGKEQTSLYLKNGYNLEISLDTKEFDETIAYKGIGKEANNYLAKKALMVEGLLLSNLDNTAFNESLNKNVNAFRDLLSNTQNLDSEFIIKQEESIKLMREQWEKAYHVRQSIQALKGKKSPIFIDYENYAGGTTSLDDFKGKFVYIDIWATWCGPCKAEIPFLKKLEADYYDKNIEFVSISIDREKAYNYWKTMIKEKEMSGIQLYAKQDKQFTGAFYISSIPRFILISPSGIVVDSDAPRPSSKEIRSLFKELNI